jgi:SAM-dependent methyltransferase
MTKATSPNPSLPPYSLLEAQAEWLAPARGRLFRRIAIAHRQSVLDLGAGYGAVSAELSRRSNGRTIALDLNHNSLCEIIDPQIHPTNADGRSLPFPDNTFDLIFCQCTLMWISPLETAVSEITRTLQPGGILVALEPDYGGLIEHPPQLATRPLWLAALKTAGADPYTGRKLPSILAHHNLTMRINLLDELQPPSPLRFDFLRGLPLTTDQQHQLTQIENEAAAIPATHQIAHLPFFLITAEKPQV